MVVIGLVFLSFALFLVASLEDIESRTKNAVSSVDNELATDADVVWPYPFVHVLNTRFMQQQPHLESLGQARLLLFEIICLQTVVRQSVIEMHQEQDVPPFLWIIKVDPALSMNLRQRMVTLVEPYPFIYLVASNVNYGIGIHPGGWRGGEAGTDVLQSEVLTGNMTLLRLAHKSRRQRIVLETRLDADDGLNLEYLKSIQEEANRKLRSEGTKPPSNDWIYWCTLNHLDWTPTPPYIDSSDDNAGLFMPVRSAQSCTTAGITLGVSVGVEEESIPRFMHQKLYEELRIKKIHPRCGRRTNATKCLKMVSSPLVGAIRCRSTTSAGMRGIGLESKGDDNALTDPEFLSRALSTEFGIALDGISTVTQYYRRNFESIVLENLQGQCTHGHSCKLSTKESLQELLDVVSNHSIGGTLVDPKWTGS